MDWPTPAVTPALLRELVLILALNCIAGQECDAPVNTLTTSCGNDSCGAFEPCLVYNSSECSQSTSSSSLTDLTTNCTSNVKAVCSYTCFRAFGTYNSDPTHFIFLVPYDTKDDDIYATASNDIITAIDQLTLSRQATNVWIQGGGEYQQITKGRVVKLELAHNMLTSQSQVTSVSLISMNLSTSIDVVPKMVPNSVTALSLSNTLLTAFPAHLASLTNVVTLHLNDNNIATVHSSITWEKLVVLDLNNNNLAKFEGKFPGLTELYLNDNNLTEIPSVVFTLQHLTKLTIQNNPLSSRWFTVSQITFLQGLTSLDLTNTDFQSSVDCNLPEQRRIGSNNVVICVSELNATSTSSASSSSASSSTSSSLPVSRNSYSLGSTSADTDRSTGDDETRAQLEVTITAALIILVVFTGTAIYCWKQRNREKPNGVYNTIHRTSSKPQVIWNDFDLLTLQINDDDIRDIRVIGTGASTVVWLVRYRNSILLASKRLREDVSAVTEHTHAFVAEIKLVAKLEHPNIVAFIGAAWTMGSDMQALFEFVENGDLCSYLSPSLPRYWTRVKLQLAVDVIEALVYVHAFNPPLVHRDLKSQNVLISADMQAKLTDFGVSKFQSTNGTTTTKNGTNRWLAPEIISGSSEYNQFADIFAFGVLLSEFDTHAFPYDDAVGRNGNRLEDVAVLQMVARGSLRPTFSDTCPPLILELAKQCMAQEARDRPPALKIAYALRTLQRDAFNL